MLRVSTPRSGRCPIGSRSPATACWSSAGADRERWRGAAVGGAEGLVRAPVAQLARARPPVAGLSSLGDGCGNRFDMTLEAEQIALVGGVVDDLPVAEVV